MFLATAVLGGLAAHAESPPAGFISLFNGKDLSGWKIPAGDNGHWKVVDGTIDCDARSEAKVADKSLWTERSFKDFVLLVDWRLKTDEPGYMNPRVKQILPDGSHKKKSDGKDDDLTLEDVDSGIYLRGSSKAQVNIWMWPIGSGEVYGYRTDPKMPKAVRAAVTPKKHADNPRGEWNHFEITIKGDRLTVVLNGNEVISNAELPNVSAEGPIALQHHGSHKDGKWTGPPSLVQFRNIYIKELE
jgi:hypothetical protein